MSRKLLFLVAVFWMLLIGGIVLFKEYTLRTGQEVLLKTQPVDPRDLFRGDYVILNYEISTLDTTQLDTDFNIHSLLDGRRQVMVPLEVVDGYARATGIYLERPQGLFITGRVTGTIDQSVRVIYGIESFFVPEGMGHSLERQPEGALDVRVVIDRYGNAVIKAVLVGGEELQF